MDKQGWTIRKIINVKGDSVTLDYGVTFNSPCFEGAEVGQTWAVNHDMDSVFAFGRIEEAIQLDADNLVPHAMRIIKQAMIDDVPSDKGGYAHSWHCNIAMMCNDAILSHDDQVDFAHKVGNDAASRFMKLCFDVETSN